MSLQKLQLVSVNIWPTATRTNKVINPVQSLKYISINISITVLDHRFICYDTIKWNDNLTFFNDNLRYLKFLYWLSPQMTCINCWYICSEITIHKKENERFHSLTQKIWKPQWFCWWTQWLENQFFIGKHNTW